MIINKILILKSSIMQQHSKSCQLADVNAEQTGGKGDSVTIKDLAAEPIRVMDAATLAALQPEANQLSPRQQ